MSATAEATRPTRKFRLLAGGHEQTSVKDPNVTEHFSVVAGHQPPIIEADRDLCKIFNAPGLPPKFEYVDEQQPAKQRTVLVDLNSLSGKPVQALIEFAADNEIDLEGKTDKKDILAAIKTALGA